MKRVIYSLFFFLLLSGTITAQTDSTFWNDAMAQIAKPTSMEGWVQLKENIDFDYSDFFSENKEAFGLGVNDELILTKSKSDDFGFMHYRFQHTYKGVKVEGCEYILHEQNGRVASANGELVCGLGINVNPCHN
jgi:Zn-dependent metalloprotease